MLHFVSMGRPTSTPDGASTVAIINCLYRGLVQVYFELVISLRYSKFKKKKNQMPFN